MMLRRYCFLGLILTLMVAGPVGAAEDSKLWRQQVYVMIAYDTIEFIDPEIALEFILNDEKDEREFLKYMDAAVARADELELPAADAETKSRFERILIPRLWEYIRAKSLLPTEEEKLAEYERIKANLQQPDWVEGARILIPHEDATSETIRHWRRQLKESEGDFRAVAEEYYKAQGELMDGYFGRVERGAMRDDMFETFFSADPAKPWFGPIGLQNGILFGKLYDKGTSGTMSFAHAERDIENRLVKQKYEEYKRETLDRLEREYKVERLFSNDITEVPDWNVPVFKIEDTSFTYREVVASLPYVWGRKDTVPFFVAATGMAIGNELILRSAEADFVRDSPDYQRLYRAALAYARLQNRLKQEYALLDATDEKLLDYYKANAETKYAKDDLYRLLIVRVSRNPDRERDAYRRHLASRRAWKAAQQAHEFFISHPDKGLLTEADFSELPGVTVSLPSTYRELSSIDLLVQPEIPGHRAGYTSPVLIGEHEYVFFHIMAIQDQGAVPFDRGRVEADYLFDQRQRIRREYLGWGE